MQITDSYQEILETLDFVDSQEEAKEITKTVLGMIATSLSEQLPDYLDYETLRGTPQETDNIFPAQCIDILQDEFNLDENNARALLNQVVEITIREAKGEVSDIIKDLDDEWKEVFDESPAY